MKVVVFNCLKSNIFRKGALLEYVSGLQGDDRVYAKGRSFSGRKVCSWISARDVSNPRTKTCTEYYENGMDEYYANDIVSRIKSYNADPPSQIE